MTEQGLFKLFKDVVKLDQAIAKGEVKTFKTVEDIYNTKHLYKNKTNNTTQH